ncbi:MAG: hypothetical protein AAF829_10005 [Pseudomonadota bacterium]
MSAADKSIRDRLRAVGAPPEAVGEESFNLPCSECGALGISIVEDDGDAVAICDSEKHRVPLIRWLEFMESNRSASAAASTARDIASASRGAWESAIVPFPTPDREMSFEPGVRDGHADSGPALRESEPARPHRGQSNAFGEKMIIALLALVFLGAGLLAAVMSGFANYLAFGAMVDDPFQSRVWSWTGIIACICSFGGFTFAYWHGAQKRYGEALRAGVIALAGAATSLVGTQMYMAGQGNARDLSAQAAQAQARVLESQIEDWRSQLNAIPDDIRSVEGLEAYIAEVERVGKTDERPYRTALDELGQARRRAELETRIQDARGDLGDLAVASISAQGNGEDSRLRAWFFSAMLEVFSSQGTSIGFVALMVLSGRREGGEKEGV